MMNNKRFDVISFLTRIFPIPFILIGLLLVVFGIYQYAKFRDVRSTAYETVATIVAIMQTDEDRPQVLVEYDYGGQRYEGVHIGWYRSNMYIGEEIHILISPSAPGHPYLTFTGGLFALTIALGAFAGLLGAAKLIYDIREAKRIRGLMQEGICVRATILAIDIKTNISFNDTNPNIIRCIWRNPIKRKKYIFTSKPVWRIPDIDVEGDTKATVSVYYEPLNICNFHVDANSISSRPNANAAPDFTS